MSVSKTRQKLVEVARELFARQGLEATTMNDIALSSGKGRRTLYTYFKSKEEIYVAVVESELDKLAEALDKVAAENIAPDVKILKLIETHLDAIKMIVRRNGSLRASFFRDIWQVERVRRNLNLHEIALFKQVLIEGNEMGLFEVENVDILADILHYCVKGIEVPYIRGKIGDDLDDRQGWEYVAKIVYGALGHKSVETNS